MANNNLQGLNADELEEFKSFANEEIRCVNTMIKNDGKTPELADALEDSLYRLKIIDDALASKLDT